MKLAQLFANLNKSQEVLERYVKNQNKFIQNEILEIKKREKEDIEKAFENKSEDLKWEFEKYQKIENLKIQLEQLSLELKSEKITNQKIGILAKYSKLKEELDLLETGFSETRMLAHYANLHGAGIDYLKGEFASIQNNTNLVLVFTNFENALQAICAQLKNDLKIPIYASELNGSGIEKNQKYLKKFGKVKSSFFNSPNWKYLDTVRKIRNSIVHNENKIEHLLIEDIKLVDTQKNLYKISNIDGIELMFGRLFITKTDFIEVVIKKVTELLSELEIELKANPKLKYKN